LIFFCFAFEQATIPEGWLENEPDLIADPDAEKPEEWDDEEDGSSDLIPSTRSFSFGLELTFIFSLLLSQVTGSPLPSPTPLVRTLPDVDLGLSESLRFLFPARLRLELTSSLLLRSFVTRQASDLQPRVQGKVVCSSHRQPRVQGSLGSSKDRQP